MVVTDVINNGYFDVNFGDNQPRFGRNAVVGVWIDDDILRVNGAGADVRLNIGDDNLVVLQECDDPYDDDSADDRDKVATLPCFFSASFSPIDDFLTEVDDPLFLFFLRGLGSLFVVFESFVQMAYVISLVVILVIVLPLVMILLPVF